VEEFSVARFGVSRARPSVVAMLVVGLAVAAASPAAAVDSDRQRLIDRIVAKADRTLLEVLVTKQDGDGRPEFRTIKVSSLSDARDVVGSLVGKPNVSVEMNRRVRALVNDPLYSKQWALNQDHLRFSSIQSITAKDTARVKVAVIDSGVQGGHPDLVDHMMSGYDATTGNTTSAATDNDTCGHGTHVAGIIGARVNNRIGVVGLAQRAQIRSVRVLQWRKPLLSKGSCEGDTGTVVRGITWAADHAQVLNLSLGSDSSSSAESAAIKYAIQTKHRVVVAAAGNCDTSCTTRSYPAGYDGVLGVAALNTSGDRASFSSYGSWVDVAAPGTNIVSTVPDGYGAMEGTSMATPFVAATAALGIQHCHWSGSTTTSKIMKTASHASHRNVYSGFGQIRPTVLLRC
jgi:subtilisin family serine protease